MILLFFHLLIHLSIASHPLDRDDVVVGNSISYAIVNHTVYAWGSNRRLGLGVDGTDRRSATPLRIERQLGKVKQVATTAISACFTRKNDSLVMCLGNGAWGILGDGQPYTFIGPLAASIYIPQRVLAVGKARAISGHGTHLCAVAADVKVWCWGQGVNGELGYGGTASTENRGPVRVVDLPSEGLRGVAAGGAHSCVISDVQLWCWGSNSQFELGQDVDDSSTTPKKADLSELPASFQLVQVDAGGQQTCVSVRTDSDGLVRLYCTGLLPNTTRLTEIAFDGYDTPWVTAFSVGQSTICAVLAERDLYCMGDVPGVADGYHSEMIRLPRWGDLIHGVAVKYTHMCALVDNTVQCSGTNAQFECGSAAMTVDVSVDEPVTVALELSVPERLPQPAGFVMPTMTTSPSSAATATTTTPSTVGSARSGEGGASSPSSSRIISTTITSKTMNGGGSGESTTTTTTSTSAAPGLESTDEIRMGDVNTVDSILVPVMSGVGATLLAVCCCCCLAFVVLREQRVRARYSMRRNSGMSMRIGNPKNRRYSSAAMQPPQSTSSIARRSSSAAHRRSRYSGVVHSSAYHNPLPASSKFNSSSHCSAQLTQRRPSEQPVPPTSSHMYARFPSPSVVDGGGTYNPPAPKLWPTVG